MPGLSFAGPSGEHTKKAAARRDSFSDSIVFFYATADPIKKTAASDTMA
jgi:hypothetical protein